MCSARGGFVVRITLLLTVSAILAIAAPSDCASGTLADYFVLPAEGCRLGTRVVLEFEPLSVLPGATDIDPTTIQVTPSSLGDMGSLLFTFNDASARNASILESFIQLTVTSDTMRGEFVTLTLMGAAAAGDGVVTGIAELCGAGFAGGVCQGSSQPLISLVSGVDNLPASSGTPGPLASFQLTHDITVDAGSAGTASLTSAQLNFTTVPEPSTAMAVISSLAAVLLARRRRSTK